MSTPDTNATIMQADQAGSRGSGADASAGRVGRVVIVLAKAPVPGRAKTRLSPPATPEGAAGLAAAALLDTLDAAAATPGARVVVALEGSPAHGVRGDEITAALAGHTVVPQRGDSLGERIAAAHADVARTYPDAVTVQIGMDTPQLDAGLLDDALRTVESGTAAALGLALDGGWWAVALADPGHAGLITDVPTSTDETGRRTLAALRAGLGHDAVTELPPLSDVDTADDAVRVSELVPHGRFARAVGDLLPVPGGVSP
ncbi:TIGR04282 family arsenosugar biosynthesis glycosyltransferase [Actinomycetospora sp.]|jgi:hypothetical protein|uniref:TIGR04282 family arsenosugar biosynthesis glycosyltransferase n=1 Tax=Actinomycetospora sp. TaxID=1872135 RepID=UPI002F40B46F